MLNVYDLKRSLNCLCKFLSDVYDINNGGCCVIAYMIALHLDRLNVKYKLIVYDDTNKDEGGINTEVMNMNRAKHRNESVVGSGTCIHYCIYLEGAGIINKGFSRNIYSKYSIGGIRAIHLRWLYENGRWSKEYDTKNNKIIRGIINSFFKKYE